MSNLEQVLKLHVKVDSSQLTAKQVDQNTRNLLKEIKQNLDVKNADLLTQTLPDGTRSGEEVVIGAIILSLLPVFIDKLIDIVILWAKRHDDQKISLEFPVGKKTITIEYNPTVTTRHELKKLMNEAIKTAGATGEH